MSNITVGSTKSYHLMQNAAKRGNIKLMKKLLDDGYTWEPNSENGDVNEDTCCNAALNGHLKCLVFARTNGCPWDATTCHSAVFGGHLRCLQYALKNNCPYNNWKCELRNGDGFIDVRDFCENKACLKYIRNYEKKHHKIVAMPFGCPDTFVFVNKK